MLIFSTQNCLVRRNLYRFLENTLCAALVRNNGMEYLLNQNRPELIHNRDKHLRESEVLRTGKTNSPFSS